MSKVTALNEEQQQAINARHRDILVSAPAGSGKTKILVSRILALLKEGVSIDQFLVLTFTQAAAKEMKQRLMTMLDEEAEIAEGALKDHLEAQKKKLPFSYLTNFHGFCNTLIDHYGYLVGIQPGYEILSDQEALMQNCLDQTIDEALQDPAFCRFRTLYFPERDRLAEQIQRLYEVLQTLGNRDAFVQQMDEAVYGFLENQQQRDLSEWCFYPRLQQELQNVVIETLASLEELKAFCAAHGIVPFYQRPLSQTKTASERAVPYEALKTYYGELLTRLQPGVPLMGSGGLNELAIQKPAAAYQIPWKDLDDEAVSYKNTLSSKKTAITGQFKKVYDQLVDRSTENTTLVYREAHQAIAMLLDVTISFEKHYREAKQKLNVLDFNDLERYATQLLQPDLPVAQALNQKLYEIMVDEYQDTNMVQERIVGLIADATKKHVPCFMVGDMKQSIYRFRQADPEIFKQKYDTYPTRSDCLRIDLVFNYRSSKVVLDSINFIFNQIMDPHYGSLAYYLDPKAQLNYDFLRKEGATDTAQLAEVTARAKQRMAQSLADHTEILLVNSSTAKPVDMNQVEYEAQMIASRIYQLVQEGLNGEPISYRDIAVLMRQTTSFLIFKKVFDRLGIPNTIVLSRGFMAATEIRQMMMVYRALLDPCDDLALMACLKAPFDFSGYTEEQLAAVRDPAHSLFENIQEQAIFQPFLTSFADLRTQLDVLPFDEWHTYFFAASGYLERLRGLKNGQQRYQNVHLLVEKIKEKKAEIHWIGDWIAYFENLGSGADAPAVMPKDQEAVVFMTIHKSKGLEFPVVFVAMHDKKFNLQDGKARLIFDRHLSMSIKPRQFKTLSTTLFQQDASFDKVCVEYDNPFLSLLGRLQNQETISEEMRIYYVALTRAGKKLILTGTMDEDACFSYLQTALLQNQGNMPETAQTQGWIYHRKARHASCYLDWLMPAVFRHPDVWQALQKHSVELAEVVQTIEQVSPLAYAQSLDNTCDSHFDFQWLSYQDILNAPVPAKQVMAQPRSPLVFDLQQYAWKDTLDQPASLAVTAIEEKKVNVAQSVTPRQDHGLTPTQKGTLVHEFMEWLPLDQHQSVASVIAELYQAGRYQYDEYEALMAYVDRLEQFRQSTLFHRMQTASLCLREQPFCLEKDGQLFHGVMDVFCLTEDKAFVIDYKTDRVSKYAKNEDLISRHAQQLHLYQEALARLYPQRQIEGYLYYLETGRCVKV